mmetsp:Transcript_5811/g.16950  ORF Transcript_5811/g.16950 Transcript_5811/m.16950 type:complete len:236 (-) Transcript_5811:669-1376(-)
MTSVATFLPWRSLGSSYPSGTSRGALASPATRITTSGSRPAQCQSGFPTGTPSGMARCMTRTPKRGLGTRRSGRPSRPLPTVFCSRRMTPSPTSTRMPSTCSTTSSSLCARPAGRRPTGACTSPPSRSASISSSAARSASSTPSMTGRSCGSCWRRRGTRCSRYATWPSSSRRTAATSGRCAAVRSISPASRASRACSWCATTSPTSSSASRRRRTGRLRPSCSTRTRTCTSRTK